MSFRGDATTRTITLRMVFGNPAEILLPSYDRALFLGILYGDQFYGNLFGVVG